MILALHFAIEQIREGPPAREVPRGALCLSLTEKHQLASLIHRGQTTQQNSIEGAEDRCVRADAEGQRKDGDHREAGALAQLPDGVADVMPNVIEESQKYVL